MHETRLRAFNFQPGITLTPCDALEAPCCHIFFFKTLAALITDVTDVPLPTSNPWIKVTQERLSVLERTSPTGWVDVRGIFASCALRISKPA